MWVSNRFGYMMKPRVFLAVDSDLLLIGLRQVLENAGHVIAGEYSSDLDMADQIIEANPDVAILSWRHQGFEHHKIMRKVKRKITHVKFLLLLDQPEEFLEAVSCNADGYSVEKLSAGMFPLALAALSEYGAWIGPAIADFLLHRRAGGRALLAGSDLRPIATLTRKENEILQLMSEGMEILEIASKLSLSVETVRVHCKHINKKLNVKDRAQAVALALQGRL